MLDVALNFVDDVAAELIAKGLSKNSVLRNLSLKGNGISYKVRDVRYCVPAPVFTADLVASSLRLCQRCTPARPCSCVLEGAEIPQNWS